MAGISPARSRPSDDATALEATLVTAARTGDRAAFEALYRMHVPAVSAFLARRVRRDDVDDLVADTFVAAWRAIDRFEWRGLSVRAWLFTIAGRQVIARSRRRSSTELVTAQPEARGGEISDIAVDRLTDRLDLQAALAVLSPGQRIALELRYLADLGVDEVALLLDIAPEAVRARSHRGLLALRSDLATPPAPS